MSADVMSVHHQILFDGRFAERVCGSPRHANGQKRASWGWSNGGGAVVRRCFRKAPEGIGSRMAKRQRESSRNVASGQAMDTDCFGGWPGTWLRAVDQPVAE